jgi:hypothetical protein
MFTCPVLLISLFMLLDIVLYAGTCALILKQIKVEQNVDEFLNLNVNLRSLF